MKNLFATLLIATTLSLPAQNSLPLKKVIIFKNATAVIVKEGNAAVKNGNVMLPIPEQTLFGTFFIGTAKDNSIKNIIFKNDTVKKKVASNSIWQFLAGNKNKQVSISYTPTQGIDKTVSGKVVEYNSNSGILKFVADADKNIVIPVAKIYQADFKEDPSDFYMADSVKRLMVLNPDKPTDNISLQEIYMTTGINWIPSYYLKLKDDKIARLEMKATLENYAEELKDAETELVVGAPQMSNNGKMDPMTYDYLTVTGNSPVGYAGKSYMQSNAMVARTAEISDNSFFDQNFSTEGEKNGDMYLYKLGKISLPQNSKGVFPIFATDIEYKDKYEGTISDFTNYFNTRFVPQDEKTFDIFHSLEIKNTPTVPLTTASVMVVNKKDQFVAQDEIKHQESLHRTI